MDKDAHTAENNLLILVTVSSEEVRSVKIKLFNFLTSKLNKKLNFLSLTGTSMDDSSTENVENSGTGEPKTKREKIDSEAKLKDIKNVVHGGEVSLIRRQLEDVCEVIRGFELT